MNEQIVRWLRRLWMVSISLGLLLTSDQAKLFPLVLLPLGGLLFVMVMTIRDIFKENKTNE